MKKTRVKKGEIYWFINTKDILHLVNYRADEYSEFDDEMFNNNNYFRTKEEAEAMVRKLRAVLNGAEVIDDERISLLNSIQEKLAGAVDEYFDYTSHEQDIHPYSKEKEQELYDNMCWRWQDWIVVKYNVNEELNYNDYTQWKK